MSSPSPADAGNAFTLSLARKGITDPAAVSAVLAGVDVLTQFLATFNARDAQAWSRTLHFPHLRLTAGQIQQWETADAYIADNDLEAFRQTGWSHTVWDWIEPVQAAADKVHFALQFTRYDLQGNKESTHQALYVLTQQDGRWGVQLRSSYAGIKIPGAAY